MDSSKFATLGTPKPTIASRRPMLNSQRSLSNLVINTSATHKDFMRKEPKYRRLQTPSSVPPVPTAAAMSPEELSSKIADSFQQFSSMLTQLSSHQPTKSPSPITSPLPTSIKPQQKVVARKPVTKTRTTTQQSTKQKPDELALYATSHAIYHEKALDDIDAGNTRLRRRLLTKWLTRAASINDLAIIKQILAQNNDLVNESDDLGMVAVMYAAYFGYIDCLSYLLTLPSLKINLQDKSKWLHRNWAR